MFNRQIGDTAIIIHDIRTRDCARGAGSYAEVASATLLAQRDIRFQIEHSQDLPEEGPGTGGSDGDHIRVLAIPADAGTHCHGAIDDACRID